MRQLEDTSSDALVILTALEALARLAWNDDEVREEVAQMEGTLQFLQKFSGDSERSPWLYPLSLPMATSSWLHTPAQTCCSLHAAATHEQSTSQRLLPVVDRLFLTLGCNHTLRYCVHVSHPNPNPKP